MEMALQAKISAVLHREYFEYDPEVDNSKCVMMKSDSDICGIQLKGGGFH